MVFLEGSYQIVHDQIQTAWPWNCRCCPSCTPISWVPVKLHWLKGEEMQVPALLSPLSDKQTISLESLNLWCTNNDKECLKKNRRKDLMRDILACIPSSSAWRNWCCAPKSLEPQCQKGVAGAASSCVGPHCGASDPGTCWQRWPDPQTELKLGELSTSKHKDNGMSLRQ